MSAADLDEADADLAQADAPMTVKLSASLTAISGLFLMLCGLQLLGARFYPEWIGYVRYVQITLGLAQIYVGAMTFRARPWAGYVNVGLAAVTALGTTAWFFYFLFGLAALSCMVWVTPPIAVLAAILSVVAVPGLRRTAAARQRLSDRGLGLGL